MPFLHQLLFDYPILSALQTLFSVGVLIEEYRSGVEPWWFYFMLFVPIIGAWAYFFVVFLPHFNFKAPFWERKTPVEELRFRAQNSPTFANDLALGHRLVELGRYDEALAPLQAARKREPNHAPVCFHLAKCLYELHKSSEALPFVQAILDKEPRWEDYAAWRLLIKIQQDLDLDDATLETARQLVKLSPRMEHKYLLAEQLARLDQDGEARLVLENALQEQQFVSAPVQRVNRKWTKEARRLLSELNPR